MSFFGHQIDRECPAGNLPPFFSWIKVVQFSVVIQFKFFPAGESQRGEILDGDCKVLIFRAIAERFRIQRTYTGFPADGTAFSTEDFCPNFCFYAAAPQTIQ